MSLPVKHVDVVDDPDGPQLLPVQGGVEQTEAKKAGSRSTCVYARLARFLVFAVASALMYGVFFSSTDQLFPLLTAGTTTGAVLVIVLALAFSFIYGSCANYLLELLGFRELK